MIAHVWDAFVFMYLRVGISDILLGLDRASGMIHKACGFLLMCSLYVLLCLQLLIVT
jgi:heme A synthase